MKPLSARELAILGQLVRGSTNKEIAQDLGISEAAVNIHFARILQKLGLKTRSEAKIWAQDAGIS